MHVVASIRSISVCVHIIPCSMLIFASDWLATVKERHLLTFDVISVMYLTFDVPDDVTMATAIAPDVPPPL